MVNPIYYLQGARTKCTDGTVTVDKMHGQLAWLLYEMHLLCTQNKNILFCNLSRAMCFSKLGQLSGGEPALDATCLLNQIRVSVFENSKLFCCISFRTLNSITVGDEWLTKYIYE